PTERIPFAGYLHDRAGHDDVGPCADRGLRRPGGADAPADDEGDLDRLPDRMDQPIRHRFWGSAPRLEVHEFHPEELRGEGVLYGDGRMLAGDPLGITHLAGSRPPFD